ncbi:hypothetical protein TWF569_007522 [Orbilia oligospora]|nr:hypothetical protein TWF569_007522 [Orbilia oligospora]
MKLLPNKLVLPLISHSLTLLPVALCLPTFLENTTPANLQKRDSWNCNGSGNCNFVDATACLAALYKFIPTLIYTKETRFSVPNAITGSCLAMWTCGNSADYASAAQWGISKGSVIVTKYGRIYLLGRRKLLAMWIGLVLGIMSSDV